MKNLTIRRTINLLESASKTLAYQADFQLTGGDKLAVKGQCEAIKHSISILKKTEEYKNEQFDAKNANQGVLFDDLNNEFVNSNKIDFSQY